MGANAPYADVTAAATAVEGVVADRKRNEESTGVANALCQIQKQSEKKTQEFEKLREQMEKLTLNSALTKQATPNLVAAFQPGGDNPRVRFTDERRESSYPPRGRSPYRSHNNQNDYRNPSTNPNFAHRAYSPARPTQQSAAKGTRAKSIGRRLLRNVVAVHVQSARACVL